MKCSDCKYFKTDECKLKPEAEFFIVESFDCFELDVNNKASSEKQSSMTKEPKNTKWVWVLDVGGIVSWIGIAGIVISILLVVGGIGYLPELEALGPMILGGIGLIVSFCLAVVGAMWWFTVWISERKYWKSFDAQDSNSDYSKNVKKSRL